MFVNRRHFWRTYGVPAGSQDLFRGMQAHQGSGIRKPGVRHPLMNSGFSKASTRHRWRFYLFSFPNRNQFPQTYPPPFQPILPVCGIGPTQISKPGIAVTGPVMANLHVQFQNCHKIWNDLHLTASDVGMQPLICTRISIQFKINQKKQIADVLCEISISVSWNARSPRKCWITIDSFKKAVILLHMKHMQLRSDVQEGQDLVRRTRTTDPPFYGLT